MKPHTIIAAGVTLAVTVALAATPIANLILTGNMDAGGFRITNLGAPSTSADAATKGYTDTGLAGKVSLSGSYGDPAWLTALAWSKLTGTPNTLSGYGITDAQPLDADLTSIAALATTNFGRSLLTQADAAATRTLLVLGGSATLNVGSTSGTVAAGNDTRLVNAVQTTGTYADPTWLTGLAWTKLSGKPTTISGYGITDAQPLDGDLSALAALVTSSYGRGLLEMTSASAARTYLSLGDSATRNVGAAAGTVAAGDDSRIVNAVQTSGDQTVGGNKTLTGNLVAQGNFTGGTSSGNSAALNYGSMSAPNLPGITQRGYTMTFPDASGRLISSGNPQDFATVAQPISLSVADTYRSIAAFNINGSGLATGGKSVLGQACAVSGYTSSSTIGSGDMATLSFGDVGASFGSGNQFPTTRKILLTGRFMMSPLDAPNNNGRLVIWFGEPQKTSIGITSITRSGSTATATSSSHRLSSGEWVRIYGATETEYNGYFQISNTTANTFDFTVSGTPSTPATGAPKFDANKGYGFGIVVDASGARLAGTTSSNTYVESSPATGLAAFQNYNYHSRFFWLYWNGDGTAALYLADQSPSSTTVPARPASPSLTMSGLSTTGSYMPRSLVPSLSFVGTAASPGNQCVFGLSNLWLFTL